jgi:hypothetical protein
MRISLPEESILINNIERLRTIFSHAGVDFKNVEHNFEKYKWSCKVTNKQGHSFLGYGSSPMLAMASCFSQETGVQVTEKDINNGYVEYELVNKDRFR